MSVEEVLIEDGVVVGQGLGQSGQSGCGNLLEGGLVGLVADAAHVEDNAVLRIHVQQVHGDELRTRLGQVRWRHRALAARPHR